MTALAMVLLVGGGACFLTRVIIGPSIADRIVALDGLIVVLVGGIIVDAIRADSARYLDVAVVMAFIGFVGTIASARFIERRGG